MPPQAEYAARYEPLDVGEDAPQQAQNGRPWSAFTGKSSGSGVGKKRKDPLLGGLAIAVIVFCTLYLLMTGPDKDAQIRYLQSQISHPTAANDYYKKPGTLQLDRNEYRPRWRRARWIPLNVIDEINSMGRNGLEKDLKLGDGFDLLEDIHQALNSRDPSEYAANGVIGTFDYIQNKTILILGDGVDRDGLDYACANFFNGTRSVRRFTQPPYDLNEESLIDRRDPHLCQLSGFLEGTSIWQFMTFGILSTEDTFAKMLFDITPRRYLPRLESIVNELRKVDVRPDLILVHSTLWDLAAINHEDTRINLPPTEMLGLATLVEYRERLREVFNALNEYFPKAKKVYRTLHTTKADRGDWWMGDMPDDAQPFPRIPYAINKGSQLNAVTSQVLTEMNIGKFDIKSVLAGYWDDYEGSVHFGQIGKTIWAQMLLYYLKTDDTW